MVCLSTIHQTAKEKIQINPLHTFTQSLVYCIHNIPCYCLTQLAPTYKHTQYVSVITKFAWQSSNPATISQNKNLKRRQHWTAAKIDPITTLTSFLLLLLHKQTFIGNGFMICVKCNHCVDYCSLPTIWTRIGYPG